MHIFVMTLGQVEYEGEAHYPIATDTLFIFFCLGMPILLVNMLVSETLPSVGFTTKVQCNASPCNN